MTRKFWVPAIVVITALTGYVPAEAVTFDFDDLTSWSGPHAISSYMSALYGSDVSVRGAMVGPVFQGDPLGPDPYLFSTIQAEGPLFFPFSIDVGFDAGHPISSVRFEGAVFGDNPGHDFRLWAYTDGGSSLVQVYSWDAPATDSVWRFDSGLLTFDVPIDRLVFSDNWIYDVAIDDLMVTSVGEGGGGIQVPVPASTGLGFLGLGMVGVLVGLRKKVLGRMARPD